MPNINVDEFKVALGLGEVEPKLYIVGESHPESALRRKEELEFCKENFRCSGLYLEDSFPSSSLNGFGNPIMADPFILRSRVLLTSIIALLTDAVASSCLDDEFRSSFKDFSARFDDFVIDASSALINVKITEANVGEFSPGASFCQVEDPSLIKDNLELINALQQQLKAISSASHFSNDFEDIEDGVCELAENLHVLDQNLAAYSYDILSVKEEFLLLDTKREMSMLQAALNFSLNESSVVWKIGNDHVLNMLDEKCPYKELVEQSKCVLVTKQEFNEKFKLYQEAQNKQLKIQAAKNSSSQGASVSKMPSL